MTLPAAEVSLTEPQRQSPLAILFLLLRLIRNVGIVQIVVGAGFIISRSPSILLLAIGALVLASIATAVAVLGWWRYTFAIDAGELVVRKGVVNQDTLTVPLDRVQSVSIEQKMLHRAVGLVQVSLDTAGTSTAEFTIDAVDRPVAVALQQAAADYRRQPSQGSNLPSETDALDGPPWPEAEERVVLRHDTRKIVKMALTRMPFSGLAFAAPLVAFGDDLVDWLPIDVPEIEAQPGTWLLWFVPSVLLLVVVISVLLNMIRVLLAEWELTITATESGLRRNAGLLSKTSVASSLPRVQRVEIQQLPLERFAGIRTATLHNVGEGDFRVPGCDETQASELRSLALDGSLGVTVRDRRVSSLEVFKAVRNSSIVIVLVAFVLRATVGWWALLVLLVVPFVWWSTRRKVRLRRWGIATDAIADRHEFLGWKSDEALLRKVNGVTVRQSLFERKRDLATVRVQLAGSSISIGMIPLTEANAVRDRALFVAETDRRAFM